MKPACHNREPFTDPNAGWHDTGKRQLGLDADDRWRKRPIYRYRWPWFEPRCATWDGVGIGQPTAEYQTGTPYPIAHGFDCDGCRWKPEGTP